jgi:geranylgeranyl pyrophosphate synthase
MQDYISMISLKTGALLEKSLLIGANYANAEENYIKELSKFGVKLGIIFQITDDILGSFGDEKITGKPVDGDIREGKKTCLLIEAYNKLDMGEKVRLNQILEQTNITSNDVREIKELFIKADVINSCKLLASVHYKEAQVILDDLGTVINDSEIEFFNNILDFVYNRKF